MEKTSWDHYRTLLAVLELSGDLPENQRRALTNTVRQAATNALAHTSVKVMTRENMETLLGDMGLDAACVSQGACEVDTLRNLQANYGITGKVVDFGGRFLVTLQLYEMRGGTMMGSEQANGTDAFVLATETVPAATKKLLARLPGVGGSAEATPAVAAFARELSKKKGLVAASQRERRPHGPAAGGQGAAGGGDGAAARTLYYYIKYCSKHQDFSYVDLKQLSDQMKNDCHE